MTATFTELEAVADKADAEARKLAAKVAELRRIRGKAAAEAEREFYRTEKEVTVPRLRKERDDAMAKWSAAAGNDASTLDDLLRLYADAQAAEGRYRNAVADINSRLDQLDPLPPSAIGVEQTRTSPGWLHYPVTPFTEALDMTASARVARIPDTLRADREARLEQVKAEARDRAEKDAAKDAAPKKES